MIDQLSPHDEDIERAVLYCLIKDKTTSQYLSDISIDDFYKTEHKQLFKAVVDNFNDIDFVTVPKELKLLARALIGDIYLISNFKSYLATLKYQTNLRVEHRMWQDLGIKFRERKSPIEIKNYVLETLAKVKEPKTDTILLQNIDIAKKYEQYLHFDRSKIIKTGWKDLDDKIIGFFPGSFVAIGGIPKAGKTTFMLNMISYICGVQKKKGLFVSFEMLEEAIQAKFVAYLTAIPSDKQLGISDTATEAEKKAINKASAIVDGYNLKRTGKKGVSVDEIDKEIEMLGGVDIVFIDYLQKIKPKNPQVKKYEQVTQISNDVSMLALKYSIPVVAIVSINREYHKREDKRPILSDFRDCGNIEYDISLALMLNRIEDPDDTSGVKITEVSIAANRYGSADGIVKLLFKPEQSRFFQLEKEETYMQGGLK